MTASDLAYVAFVVDKPAANAAVFGKGSGLLRQAFACGGSIIQEFFVERCAPDLCCPTDPNHGPDAGNDVCLGAAAAAGPDHKIRGGES